jgi:hypothetical protein
MNTPSGRPLNPIEPLAYVSHEAREGGGPERNPAESGNEPPRSPYAPTRAHEPAGAERHPVENDHDPLRSPYAPKKARTRPAVEPDVAISEVDAALLVPLRAPESLREHPGRHAIIDADESDPLSHAAPSGARVPGAPLFNKGDDHSLKTAIKDAVAGADRDSASLPQPPHPNRQRHEQLADARRDGSILDLRRLEASLRWILREEAAARIPRATQLPPVSGIAPVDARARRHSGEALDNNGFRPLRSLEPQRMGPPPAMTRRDKLRGPLVILIVSIFAAPIGYYIWVGDWGLFSDPSRGPQLASFGRTIDAPPSSIGQQGLGLPMARDDDGGALVSSEIFSQRKTSQPARSSEDETVAIMQPSATVAPAPPPNKPARLLDPEEVTLLMKQGEQFIAAGDVITARVVFQRGAEAGDANAAMALGATYDPAVLAKLGVLGMSEDVEKARSWYQKAENLGSPEARRRLDVLADR